MPADRRPLRALPLLAAALCLASAASAADVIKIVSSLPADGSASAQTSTIINGIRMAIDEAGGKVVLGGTTYALVYEPWNDASPALGKWDPAVEQANADRAINDPDVVAYIGTYNSGAAKIAMPKLNKEGLVMISPANTWPGLTKPGVGEPNEPECYRPSGKITYFRVVPADDIQGAVGAAWAKEMGASKAFVLHDRELYGQGIAKMFVKSAEKLGLPVAGFEAIDGKAANYRSLVTKIRQTGADLVYFGGTTETNAGQLAKDIAASGLNVKVMMPDGCYTESLLTSAGPEALEGKVFITFGGVPPKQATGKGKAFVDAYIAKYQNQPEAYAAYGYECAKVALDGIARAGKKDRAAIVAAVAATKDFDGALGKWSFDANGDTSLTLMSGNTVKAGKFEFVKILGQ